jgi:hypothetical protein
VELWWPNFNSLRDLCALSVSAVVLDIHRRRRERGGYAEKIFPNQDFTTCRILEHEIKVPD